MNPAAYLLGAACGFAAGFASGMLTGLAVVAAVGRAVVVPPIDRPPLLTVPNRIPDALLVDR